MKRLLLLLFCVCNCAFLLAGPIDMEKARENAVQFVNQKAGHRDGASHAPLTPQNLRLVQKVMAGKNQPAYYVFDKDGGGFVIASGDDAAAPILGYSDKGSYDAASLSEGLRDLLKNYEKQISFVSSQKESKPRRINDNWAEINPFVKTHWDQTKPFNTLCPIDPTTNERSITGCVAVALAQVMYYYKWPEVGTGRVSYQWKNQTLSADFSKVHFQWNKMKLDYQYNTPDEGNAVATLLYNCALAAEANFGSSSTCASFSTETLSKYFGYKDQMTWLSLDQTTIDDFEATIYHELKNARPVLFDAVDGEMGHAMVIDGFKDGYFHINFGWRGDQDGYYQLTAILTDWYFFNTGQSIVYNIQPDPDPHVDTHLYPESSYTLSADGKELVKWKGAETEIDMTADAAFNEVRMIKSHAFSNNNAVISVILPDKTEVIETKGFENCQELETVFIPQHVIKIEPQAFEKCPYLDQLVVSDNSYNYKLQDGLLIDVNENVIVASAAGLSGNVVIPEGIIGISSYALTERQITSVKMPKSLTTIDEGAFMGCQLISTLTLPDELQFIGAKAFKGCTGLRQIAVRATMPPQVKEGTFDDVDYTSVYLCVPSESQNLYLNAYGWNQFETVIGISQPEAQKLVVYMKDGGMDSYMLSERPVITSMGQDLVISTASSSKTYKIDKIRRMQYFEEEADPSLPEDEPYAVFKGGTLTFYYDQLKKSRSGETFELNTDDNYPDWYGHPDITKVVFDPSFTNARPTTTYRWFCGMSGMTSMEGIQYLNTSSVTNMAYMFRDCSALTSLDVSHFDTSNVRDMSNMFYYLYLVTSLDVSHFDTSSCTDMSSMFECCFHMSSLDVSHFNTSKVTTMHSMFDSCYPLTILDVSHFDTSNCKDLGWMFYQCDNLTSLDVSNFDTSNCTNMEHLFSMCDNLTSLDVSHFDTSNCTNMNGMFYDCWRLNSLDVSHFDTSKCTRIDEMFKYDSGLKKLSISSSMVNLGEDACEDVGDWYEPCTIFAPEGFNFGVDTSGDYFVWKSGYFKLGGTPPIDPETDEPYAVFKDGTLTFYYDKQRNSREGTCFDLNDDGNDPAWFSVRNYVTKVIFDPSFANARPTTTYRWFDDVLLLESIEGMQYLNTSNVTNMQRMFNGLMHLESLDVSHFDTSNVTNMEGMFHLCYKLSSLDVSHFNTSKVTNMSEMFSNIYWNLTSLDVSNFDTSNCTDMSNMFAECYQLSSLNVSHFNTSKVTNMSGMFKSCDLTNLDLSNFDTSNVTDISGMFYHNDYLTSLDLSSFNTSKVTNMSEMFYSCSELTNLDLSHFDTSNVTDMNLMFSWCESLTNLDISHFNTTKVNNMEGMFCVCPELTSLDVSHFDTSNVTDMGSMFYQCKALTSLDARNFDMSKCEDSERMFYECSSLKSLCVSPTMDNINEIACGNVGSKWNPCTIYAPEGFNFGVDTSGDYFVWKSGYFKLGGTPPIDPETDEPYAVFKDGTLTFYYDNQRNSREGKTFDLNKDKVYPGWTDAFDVGTTKVVFDASFANARPTTTYMWFYGMNDLNSIEGMQYLSTSKVTNMNSMFCWCESLTNLDVSHFNTSKVTDMCSMFRGCSALTSLDVSHFDTSNVKDMSGMFEYDEGLTNLDLSSFNTSKVTSMSCMFMNCFKLNSLDVSHFDTSNVTDMSGMFEHDEGLTNLDLSSFNTSKVTNMSEMFYVCSELTSLDLSHFDTSNVTDMNWMFCWCESLTNLDVSHFNTSKVTNMRAMFLDCPNLTNLDLSLFDTSNVIDMGYMFNNCEALTILDLGHFDISKCEDSERMFGNCSSLKTLCVSSTMENLDETACDDIGGWQPCTLIAPEGFNFGVDTSGDSFVWKQGTFKLGATGIQGLLDFSQLPPYSHVEIFNTAGKMIKNYRIGEIPQALDLNGVGIGVFLVKINGVTYKIVRK